MCGCCLGLTCAKWRNGVPCGFQLKPTQQKGTLDKKGARKVDARREGTEGSMIIETGETRKQRGEPSTTRQQCLYSKLVVACLFPFTTNPKRHHQKRHTHTLKQMQWSIREFSLCLLWMVRAFLGNVDHLKTAFWNIFWLLMTGSTQK